MGRIDRYVLSQLLAVFGLASLILVLIYWINRAVSLFDALIADGQSAWVFLEFTALALPSVVRIALPIAAFVAVLWTVNRLTADSELTAARAAGMSPWRLARPVLAFGLVVAVLASVLVHTLGPASSRRAASRTAEIAETATASLLREGEFVSPAAGLTLYVRDITPDGGLRGLLLSDGRDPDATATYTATSAYVVRAPAGPQLVMLDGLIQRLTQEGRGLAVTSFSDLAYDLAPLLGSAGEGRTTARQFSTLDLLRPTPALAQATGRSEAALVAEAHERFAESLLPPVAALLAFATMMVAPFRRTGGAWQPVVGAVLLAVLIRGVDSAAAQAIAADPGRWPLTYASLALGAAIAAVLLWHAGRPRRMTARPEAEA